MLARYCLLSDVTQYNSIRQLVDRRYTGVVLSVTAASCLLYDYRYGTPEDLVREIEERDAREAAKARKDAHQEVNCLHLSA